MKRKIKAVIAVAAVVIATAGIKMAHNEFNRTNESNLLLENIEALSDDSGENEPPRCGTKSVLVDYTFPCPIKGHKIGFVGTEYSCQSNGSEFSCKVGSAGKDYSCTPYHGTTVNINTVKTISCDEM